MSYEIDGLTFVDTIEWDDGSYQFDMTMIQRDDEGGFWIADDSGCSCPSPFEDVTQKSDFNGPYDKAALRWQLEQRIEDACRSRAELVREISGILESL